MNLNPFVIGGYVAIAVMVGVIVWLQFRQAPNAAELQEIRGAVREKIQKAINTRGMTFIDMSTEIRNLPESKQTILIYVARVKNPYGNVQELRFSRDIEASAFQDVEYISVNCNE